MLHGLYFGNGARSSDYKYGMPLGSPGPAGVLGLAAARDGVVASGEPARLPAPRQVPPPAPPGRGSGTAAQSAPTGVHALASPAPARRECHNTRWMAI